MYPHVHDLVQNNHNALFHALRVHVHVYIGHISKMASKFDGQKCDIFSGKYGIYMYHTQYTCSVLPSVPTHHSILTFFDDLNDVSLFEGELVCVRCIIVIDGLAQRHVGLGSWWRLLASSGRWLGTVEHGPVAQCEGTAHEYMNNLS
jgi:hypothetical protein